MTMAIFKPRIWTSFFLLSASLITGCSTLSKEASSVSSSAEAKEVNPRPIWATPYYLSALPFSLEKELSAPPREGSETDRQDLSEVLRRQKKRTQAQCEEARQEEIPTLLNAFGYSKEHKDLLDFSKMQAQSYERLKNFFDRAERDVTFVVYEAKDQWKRLRPFVRDGRIQPCARLESSYAYPSSHAAYASAGAVILAEIFPKKAPVMERATRRYGLNRVMSGVHHPTDIQAGFELGRKVIESLRKNPKFQSDLEEVKKAFAGKSPF